MAENEATIPPPADENPFGGPNTPPSRKGRRFLLWGCGTVVAVVAFFVLVLSLLMSYGKRSAVPIVERFLHEIENERYAEAYAQIGEEWKKVNSFEDFKRFFERINETLGRHKSLKLEAYRIEVKNGVSIATAGFNVEYPTGPALITVNLRSVGSDWKIVMMNFNSKLLVTQMRCPGCGRLVSISAKFCSHCGSALSTETPAPPAGKGEPAEESTEAAEEEP